MSLKSDVDTAIQELYSELLEKQINKDWKGADDILHQITRLEAAEQRLIEPIKVNEAYDYVS